MTFEQVEKRLAARVRVAKSFSVSGNSIRYVADSNTIKQWIEGLPSHQRALVTGTHEAVQRDGKWFAKFSDGFVSPFGKRTKEEAFNAVKVMIGGIMGNIV